uniref:Uncharacterized protein n=1 Tax=uncultured bacterium EC5 TaxID=672206 RepID=G4WV79_9BACT|nr:hypothetical protein [uncultured bacterium EC5]
MHAFFDAEPPSLTINAWTGSDVEPARPSPEQLHAWLRSRPAPPPLAQRDRWPKGVKPWDWQSPNVGWGLVLPDDPKQPAQRLATAADAPEPIQRLVAARGNAPVLRWRANAGGIGQLRRYRPDGRVNDLGPTTEDGIGPGQMPHFLLIYAPPDQIPWTFQYAANLRRHVGRLWLQGEALDNYVDALINDWSGCACDVRAPLVWSVDYGEPDITWLMDRAISQKLAKEWVDDPDFVRTTHLSGRAATQDRLIDKLAGTRPALVVTTSHGMTGPLDDAAVMASQLGLPVDANRRVLDLQALCERWQPNGAIWYSHACCAAGSDAKSAYEGLAGMGSGVARVLSGVATGCGATIAPLPQRLLGAKHPLRAFIGHVEPTFDWTLRNPDPDSRQLLTHGLVKALNQKLFEDGQRRPIGWAMETVFDDVGVLLDEGKHAIAAIDAARPRSLTKALYYQIAAMDRQHTVILGDPTVALPV